MKSLTIISTRGKSHKVKIKTLAVALVIATVTLIFMVGSLLNHSGQMQRVQLEKAELHSQIKVLEGTIDSLTETNLSLGESLKAVEAELESIKANFERYKKEVGLRDDE